MELTGLVFDIKKFAIHDGPGIRTTVFLKGCYLRCCWCHNPESIEKLPEIMFTPEKCIGCAYCVAICPQLCHHLGAKGHDYSRDACEKCGACTQKCYTGALEMIGKSMTVATVLREVLSDQPFYESSRGGVTISGGEPMFQFDFTRALLLALKAHAIHTCLDTSGFAPSTRYQQLLAGVDLFLYDLKETDPVRHLAYIGVPLAPILENLEQLDAWGSAIILRCPIIPSLNDRPEHFTQIAQVANRLQHLLAIEILPYHPLGKSKSQRLGKDADSGKSEFPPKTQIETWVNQLQAQTSIPVRLG